LLAWRKTELARKSEAGESIPRILRAEIAILNQLISDMQSPPLFHPKIPITINQNDPHENRNQKPLEQRNYFRD
jgi:hypothetical protein